MHIIIFVVKHAKVSKKYVMRESLANESAEQSVVRKANDRQCTAKARASKTELESVVRKAKNRQSMSTQILQISILYWYVISHRGISTLTHVRK